RELLGRALRPDDSAVDLDQAPVRLIPERHLREAGHHERVREAEEGREQDDGDEGRDERAHQCISPSTIGPSVSAGKIIRPAVRPITPTSRTTKVGPSVRNVPAETGWIFFVPSAPPSPRAASSGTKRPKYSATVPRLAEKLVAP